MTPETPQPDGFEVPLHLSLTQQPLFAGVPREFGILTLVTTLMITLGFQMWWFGIPAGLALYGVAAALTRLDEQWLPVFRAHLKFPTFLDW